MSYLPNLFSCFHEEKFADLNIDVEIQLKVSY